MTETMTNLPGAIAKSDDADFGNALRGRDVLDKLHAFARRTQLVNTIRAHLFEFGIVVILP